MSRQPKYNKAVDANQKEIVRLLNELPNVRCYVIGDPVDLLVGCRKHNFLVELKKPSTVNQKSAYTEKQQKFIEEWAEVGQIRVASTFEEIVALIYDSYK